MDTTELKVGDKIRLRNGETHTVTEYRWRKGYEDYPVVVNGETYTAEGAFCRTMDSGLDIAEIIPSGSNSEESAPESRNDPERDDIVVKPSHYTQFKIEPVTFVMENRLSFEIGNIVKYACRAGSKLYPGQDETQSRITDLEKVRRYAEMEINRLKGEEIL